jgi:hypothetical protein
MILMAHVSAPYDSQEGWEGSTVIGVWCGAFASGVASFSRRGRILASLTRTAGLRRGRWLPADRRAGANAGTEKEMLVRMPQTRTPRVTPESQPRFNGQISSTSLLGLRCCRATALEDLLSLEPE